MFLCLVKLEDVFYGLQQLSWQKFFSVASSWISSLYTCLNKCERIVFAEGNDPEEPHEIMK